MDKSKSSFSHVRGIDNSRQWLPLTTSFLLLFLIVLFIWFFKGGSIKLYASAFFSLYALTGQIWISVLMIGVIQNIIFLPLRFIGGIFRRPQKDFEDELEKVEEKQQILVLSKKVKEGNLAIVFYVLNFFLNAIAFFSAGRLFLIDFYNYPVNKNLLYSWVPYPNYPLQGTDLKLPLIKISQTYSLPWSTIFLYLGGLLLFMTLIRLIFRIFRFIYKNNKKILSARIRYNRLILKISGFSTLLLVIVLIFLRHIPIAYENFVFIANLTVQNTTLNFVTAMGTFLTTVHAGYKGNSIIAKEALKSGIPQKIVTKVFKEKMQISIKNGLILGIGAFLVTNHIPSAFELSIASFEIMYIIYPYTFGHILTLSHKVGNLNNSQVVKSA